MIKFTNNAKKYVVKQLFDIAFPNLDLRNNIIVEKNNVAVLIENNKIIFETLCNFEVEKLSKGELKAIYLLSFDNKTSIPLFYHNNNIQLCSINEKNELVFNCDLLTLPFLLLTQYPLPIDTFDNHNRLIFKNSLHEKYNFIDFPVVDHYAMIIRKEITKLFPSIKPLCKKTSIIITHDIDELYRFSSFLKTLKTTIGGDLIKRKSIKMFICSLYCLKNRFKNKLKDPYIEGLFLLIEVAKQIQNFNTEQIVFFKSQKQGEFDCTYNITAREVKNIINILVSNGIKIGIHGSYNSYDNDELLILEKNRLSLIAEKEIFYGRQHFLRFNTETTVSVWQKSKIMDDFTIGFAEKEGFRAGTCHPYKFYNIEQDCVTPITEHPLLAMDGTFFQYQKTVPEEAELKLRALFSQCYAVEGDFVILWHNTTVFREYENWFNKCFINFIKEL